jgi:hypothetical protein
LTKKKKYSPVLVIGGERERVEKDPSLVDSSTGIRFLVNRPSVKQITRVLQVKFSFRKATPYKKELVFSLFLSKPSCFNLHKLISCIDLSILHSLKATLFASKGLSFTLR